MSPGQWWKPLAFWGLQAIPSIEYSSSPWGSSKSPSSHMLRLSWGSRKASGFPPRWCVGEEQLTCPIAVSHPQGTTTVPLPTSRPSHQTLHYLVGKSLRLQPAEEAQGRSPTSKPAKGVWMTALHSPWFSWVRMARVPSVTGKTCSASQLCLTSCFSWKRKKLCIPKASSSPRSHRAHVP